MFEFANVPVAYLLWALFGLFGGHRFYVGRWESGLVYMFTLGGCLVGWIIDGFILPQLVEDHNKRVFQQQMLETGNSLLFEVAGGDNFAPYPNSNPYAGAGGGYTGGPAAYSQHHYYERPGAGRPQAGYAPQGNSWQQQQQQQQQYGGGGGGYDQQYTY